MLKIAIIGSRNYQKLEYVIRYVYSLEGQDVTVVSGGARGVGKTATSAAMRKNIEYIEFLPDWDEYGKQAGYLRNTIIVDSCDILVAFWDGQSKGTRDSINKAKLAGKTIIVYDSNGKLMNV